MMWNVRTRIVYAMIIVKRTINCMEGYQIGNTNS